MIIDIKTTRTREAQKYSGSSVRGGGISSCVSGTARSSMSIFKFVFSDELRYVVLMITFLPRGKSVHQMRMAMVVVSMRWKVESEPKRQLCFAQKAVHWKYAIYLALQIAYHYFELLTNEYIFKNSSTTY